MYRERKNTIYQLPCAPFIPYTVPHSQCHSEIPLTQAQHPLPTRWTQSHSHHPVNVVPTWCCKENTCGEGTNSMLPISMAVTRTHSRLWKAGDSKCAFHWASVRPPVAGNKGRRGGRSGFESGKSCEASRMTSTIPKTEIQLPQQLSYVFQPHANGCTDIDAINVPSV